MRIHGATMWMAGLMLLAECGGGGSSGGVDVDPPEPPPEPPPTEPVSYTVPDDKCPENYTGLTITTDVPAEVEYLNKIVACTDGAGAATYLFNDSDAVWTFRNLGAKPGTATYWDYALEAESFEQIVSPGLAVLVPEGSLTIDLPPESLQWDLDPVKSVAWQGHAVVVEKLWTAGDAVVVAALKRESPAGAALVACTRAVAKVAESKTDLENSDLIEVVLDGLDVTVSGSMCASQSAEVVLVEQRTGQSVALADDIAKLKQQTALLAKYETKLSNASRLFQVITFVRLASPRVP